MEKQFVTYKIAKALKELGFDEECLGWFWGKNRELALGHIKITNLLGTAILAPLWQQCTDWLRNTHKLEIKVSNYYNEHFWVEIEELSHPRTISRSELLITDCFKSHNEALETGIIKALDICQTKK